MSKNDNWKSIIRKPLSWLIKLIKVLGGTVSGLTIAILLLLLSAGLSDVDLSKELFDFLTSKSQSVADLFPGSGKTVTKLHIILSILFIFIVMFVLQESAKFLVARDRRKEFEGKLSRLPAPKALEKFEYLSVVSRRQTLNIQKEIYDLIGEDLEGKKLNSLIQKTDNAVRIILSILLDLLEDFSPTDGLKKCRYAANVMIFERRLDIIQRNPEEIEAYVAKLSRFLESPSLYGLDGVLKIVKELSAVHISQKSNKNYEPHSEIPQDDELVELILPVPELDGVSKKSQSKTRTLPGAPTAFQSDENFAVIYDTLKLLEEFDATEQYDIARGIFEQGHHYFKSKEEGKNIRGIISISLPDIYSNSNADFGVLNLHCNHPFDTKSYEKLKQFRELISPIVIDVACLITDRTILLRQSAPPG